MPSNPIFRYPQHKYDIKKQPLPAEEVFKSVKLCLKCLGITVNKSETHFIITCMRYCFSTFLFIAMCLFIVMILRFWLLDLSSFGPLKIRFVHVTSVYLMSIVSFGFLLFWQQKNKFVDHLNLLRVATGQKGLISNEKRIHKISTTVIVAGWLSTIGMVGFGSFATWPRTHSMFPEISLLLFDDRLYFLILFIHFYMIISCSFSCVTFVLICFLDKTEFKYLNTELLKEAVLNCTTLETYIVKHTKLTNAVSQANDTFKYYLLITLAIGISSLVFDVYEIFVCDLTLQLKIMYWLVGLYFIVYDLILCVIAASVHSEVKKL